MYITYSLLLLATIPIVSAGGTDGWSYVGEYGPDHWKDMEGAYCGGKSQSPINIERNDIMLKKFDEFKFAGYDTDGEDAGQPIGISNHGHTAEVALSEHYSITGGGLPSTFKAVQFHFHWGSEDGFGSEHSVDDEFSSAEMHIVHFDSDRYENLTDALTGDGHAVAVLGVLLEVGESNAAFDHIFEGIEGILFKDEEVHFNDTISVRDLLPKDLTKFYRYQGSLTTPTCNEVVIWTVFEDTIDISVEQLNMLRGLHKLTKNDTQHSGTPQHLVDNFRPTQAINGRTVYYSSAAMRGLSVFSIGLWTMLQLLVLS